MSSEINTTSYDGGCIGVVFMCVIFKSGYLDGY